MSDADIIEPPGPLKKFTILRQQHAKLYVEREHMIVNVKRNILAGFQRKLGTHDHALKKAEWEVGRLKREVEMVRACAENGEVDYDRIAGALEEEFDPGEQELEEAPRKIEWANQRFNAMMTREQTHAFQARFRRLTERLHPDLRFDKSATAVNLWERAQEAFVAGDAAELEAIELLAEDLSPENLEKRPVEEIEERVARLKTANESTINEIAAMRQEWPFPLAAKLPDEEWVKTQREDYERKTAQLLAERDALVEELNRILDTRPTEKE
jgi:vacuolar-type H+-ATPase subunit I/STV1